MTFEACLVGLARFSISLLDAEKAGLGYFVEEQHVPELPTTYLESSIALLQGPTRAAIVDAWSFRRGPA